MYKQKPALYLSLFLLCNIAILSSQISVSPSSGCLPAGLTNAIFSYIGSGTPTNIVWNYGDGSPISSLPSTQHSYPNAGSYTVTFSASIGGTPVTYTNLVVVNVAPTGTFSSFIPNNHCKPMLVNFTAGSTGGNVNYMWAFGDLLGGSGTAPSHVYNSSGTFTPIVTIQNSLTGCFVNISGSPISVSSPPTISITASPGVFTCAPTFTTSLDAGGSSSGSPFGGGLTYNWNLGPFGTSTQVNTGNVVFQPVGDYIVTLTATDNNSCSATATKTISLLSPTVSATVPATVCIKSQMPYSPPVFIATVNSNQPSTTWDMGDGTIVIFPIPLPPPQVTPTLTPNVAYSGTIHTYTVAGPKTVIITAIVGQCVATITKTILVEKITPQFTFSQPSFTCSPAFTIDVINQTTVNTGSSLNYTWQVNGWGGPPDAYTSTATSAIFTVTQNGNQYVTFGHPPYYVIPVLFVESIPLGCLAKIGHVTDTVYRPTALFEVDQGLGCAPLSVTFTNTSVTNMAIAVPPGLTPSTILSYTWNFGVSASSTLAGIPVAPSFSIPPATYTYTNPGTYYPTLSIQTTGGCSHTSYVHTITVVDPPAISYTLPISPVCAGQTVQVHLASPQNVNHWHVETDAGYFSGCVNDAHPIWKLNHVGTHDYTISATSSGCKSTSVIPAGLTVKGPACKLRYETNCSGNRRIVKFYYHLEDAVSATLDFGDNSVPLPISVTAGSILDGITTYTYANSVNSIDYTATLTALNGPNACLPSTATVQVTITNLKADFEFADSVICGNFYLELDALNSVNVFTACGKGYVWFVDNNIPFQTTTHTYIATNDFSAPGMHTVKLLVRDVNGCSDTKIKNFRVSAPAPNFTFNANPICLSDMPVTFINTTPQILDVITNYTFYAGDGVLYNPLYPDPYHTTFTTNTSPNFSPSFAFPHIGGLQTRTFTVSLFAMNDEGCRSYTRQVLTVNDPIIDIKRSDYKGCAPAAFTFSFNAASTHTNYNINWGDGSPVVNVTSYSTNATYTDTHIYLSPGTYTPTFVVTDFGGCSKPQTFSLPPMIIQTAPVSTFTFYNAIDNLPGPGPFCAPFSPSVVSIRNSPYPLNYTWDLYGIGGMLTLDSTAFTNYPDGPATYTISLKAATIPAGCSSYSQNIVQIFAPHIGFVFDPDSLKTAYCLGDPITVSLTTFPGVQYYKWDFSDGVITPSLYPVPGIPATLKTIYPNLFYPESTNGNLVIELVGYAGNGNKICKDVQRKMVRIIKAKPDFNRNNELLGLDSIHCLGRPELFKNLSTSNIASALNYTWSLGDGTINNNTDVFHTYASPGTYSVKLDVLEPIYSCTASITKKMLIFPLPTASMSVVPSSCPKIPFVLNGSGTPGVSGVLSGTILPGPLTPTFNSSNDFSVSTTASVSTTYTLKVVDNNGCENSSAAASIYIPPSAPEIHWDTTIVIGQPTPLNAYIGPGFSYTWTPLVDYLNCDSCLLFNPVSTTTSNITYSVSVEDDKKCSVVQNTYRIYVEIRVSLDVPTAFTPNGDGVNDMIYPGGWGLKKLNYFKVFNRWGQLVFESNDLNIGWDGVFKGVPQNIETYVYQVSAETYLDSQPTLTQTGTFKLLR